MGWLFSSPDFLWLPHFFHLGVFPDPTWPGSSFPQISHCVLFRAFLWVPCLLFIYRVRQRSNKFCILPWLLPHPCLIFFLNIVADTSEVSSLGSLTLQILCYAVSLISESCKHLFSQHLVLLGYTVEFYFWDCFGEYGFIKSTLSSFSSHWDKRGACSQNIKLCLLGSRNLVQPYICKETCRSSFSTNLSSLHCRQR